MAALCRWEAWTSEHVGHRAVSSVWSGRPLLFHAAAAAAVLPVPGPTREAAVVLCGAGPSTHCPVGAAWRLCRDMRGRVSHPDYRDAKHETVGTFFLEQVLCLR